MGYLVAGFFRHRQWQRGSTGLEMAITLQSVKRGMTRLSIVLAVAYDLFALFAVVQDYAHRRKIRGSSSGSSLS